MLPCETPSIPVLHNADVAPIADGARDQGCAGASVVFPVRWVETVLEFGKQGITHNVECGAGQGAGGAEQTHRSRGAQALAINDGDAHRGAHIAAIRITT